MRDIKCYSQRSVWRVFSLEGQPSTHRRLRLEKLTKETQKVYTNLTYFQPRKRGNVENNNSPLNIRFSPKHQTSEISLKTSDLMLKHQKWQHWLSLCTKSFFKCTGLPVAPEGVLIHGKGKFALKYSNGKGMPSGFSNFYCHRVVLSTQKKCKGFFNISGRLVVARWSPTAKNIVSGLLVQPQRPAQNPDH